MTTNTAESARGRLRDLLRRDAGRAERLPAAVCRVCGGLVRAGQGERDGDGGSPWEDPMTANSWKIADDSRRAQRLPIVARWRRRHTSCTPSPEYVVQVLTGLQATREQAGEALARLHEPVIASVRGRSLDTVMQGMFEPRPTPWGHVNDDTRRALRAAVQRVKDETEPRRCRDGACAWCGVERSIGWFESPETWADGSPAPLCATCNGIHEHRLAPSDRDELRACALEALAGVNWLGSQGLGIRTYCDLAGADHTGTAEPWQYAPEALADLRERARRDHPDSLPGDMREHYRALCAADRREVLARYDAHEQAEAEAEIERLAAQGWRIG